MASTSKTILFFGTEDFSAHTLVQLIESGFTIGAIITKPDSRRGRRASDRQPKVKTLGLEHDIPVWQPEKLSEIVDDIKQFDSPTGVLVSFGKIIPQSIIDLFHPGIINLHPSLLPSYRGPSPIEAAILAGDTVTGLSIMQLSARMDAGPVYAQETVPLTGTETAPQLYDSLGQRGAELMCEVLPSIIDGSLTPVAQDEVRASYCSLIAKADGVIDWTKPAARLEREIRAYAGWPGSRTLINTTEVIVTKAQHQPATDLAPGQYTTTDTTLVFGTPNGALSIEQLKPVGKKEMPVQAFLAGYQKFL